MGSLDPMSKRTYPWGNRGNVSTPLKESVDKPLLWIHGEILKPPFSKEAAREAGILLRQLQQGDVLGLPMSRPMPDIGKRCHELRIQDVDAIWRIIYRTEPDAILILEVFKKKTQKTPKAVIEECQKRLARYLAAIG